MNWRKASSLLLTIVLLVILLPSMGIAQEPPQRGPMTYEEKLAADQVGASGTPLVGGLEPVVRLPLKHDVSPPLRDIQPKPPVEGEPIEIPLLDLPKVETALEAGRFSKFDETIVQDQHGVTAAPAPFLSFDGTDNDDNAAVLGFRIMPPDTDGDVGPNHYVQWNNSVFEMWDKAGNSLYGPAAGNTLWTGFGGYCETTNDGDPITLYDQEANRWFMSQFALPNYPSGPFYQCIAVSQTGDPLGSWYRYAYEWEDEFGGDVMNDYPKFGVWPDAYYMMAHQFYGTSPNCVGSWCGTGVAAFERDQMLLGNAAQMVYFDLAGVDINFGGMLPADWDGTNPPPAGAPGIYVEWDDSTWLGDPDDTLRLWEFDVDWATPANSTFGVGGLPNALIATADIDPNQGDIPQPGTSQTLDAIADRLMHRLQYRNFGDYQTLVSNRVADVDGTDHAGIYWFELRDSGSGWAMHQEGVYAPDSDDRWMGSIAMNGRGDIALGYTVSSGSTYPSARYTARVAEDPAGVMQDEAEFGTGISYQYGGGRWGDYSMMSADPIDDCTFWVTDEYINSDPADWGNWDTRIGAFQFAHCLGTTGTLTGLVYDAGTMAPIPGADVEAADGSTFNTISGGDGIYTMTVVADTYDVTGSAFGYLPNTIPGVVVNADETVVQDIALTAAPTSVVSGTVTDATTGWPLYASIDTNSPSGVVWTDPETGYYSIALPEGMPFDFHVEAWVPGYIPEDRVVGPLSGDTTENFALDADLVACVAPGYTLDLVLDEDFDPSGFPSDWTVVNNGGDCVWRDDDPGGVGNNTGGSGLFAIANSDYCGSGSYMDTELQSPAFDASGSTVLLEFKSDYDTYTGADVIDVDVWDGSSWNNVLSRSGTPYPGPETVRLDIAAASGGSPSAQVRFHYYDAYWEWWWSVDDVRVGALDECNPPAAGGLVVGNVYDENTLDPLVDAKVENDTGGETFALATPADPNVDDAFYTLFSPPGDHLFTASYMPPYGTDDETVTVVDGDTVGQDFYLPAPHLVLDPEELEVWVVTGTLVYTHPTGLDLINDGGQDLEFEIVEISGTTTMLSLGDQGPGVVADEGVQVTLPEAAVAFGPGAKVGPVTKATRPPMSFVVPAVAPRSAALDVLLLTPDQGAGGDISLIQTTLAAFPDLSVTLWDSTAGDPSGIDLAPYGVVIVGNDYLWTAGGMTPVGVGNALADYIDMGGKVIDTLFVHDWAGWQLGGRYITDGYAPFTASTADMTGIPYTMGTVYDPGHPLMAGVTSITDNPVTIGIGHQNVGLSPGATRLADWNDGEIFIAYNVNVVGINQLWYHGSGWSGDVPTLMHNALLYLAGPPPDVPWIWEDPISGTVPAGTAFNVDIMYTALYSDLTPMPLGDYYATLAVRSNDPVSDTQHVPILMHIEPAPCTEVVAMTLSMLTPYPIYMGDMVDFEADIMPSDFTPPFSYTIDFGDGSVPLEGSSDVAPMDFSHAFVDIGTMQVEVQIWNCGMEVPVSHWMDVEVTAPMHYIYLPIVFKDAE